LPCKSREGLESTMSMRSRYNRGDVIKLLEQVLETIGPPSFAEMRLLPLEALVRKRAPKEQLPGKTVLREIINGFRSSRWAHTAPKKLDRSRYR
jgi:hypothetical protein